MKKVGILLVVCMIAVSFITGCGKKEEKNYLKEITLADYLELKSKKQNALVYIDSNDDISAKFKKSLNSILNDLNIKVKYVDTTKFKNDEETMKFMDADKLTKESYEVPMIVFIKNGKIDGYTSGYTNDEKIRDFIRANS